ncbi:MAG: holo-ACP synthase [Parachlamydiales bacterium]
MSTSYPGIDLVEIARFAESVERQGEPFLKRLFTPSELAYCRRFADPLPHYAARFAAKEAVAKALECGIGEHLSWHDVEVGHTATGSPTVTLSERAQKRFGDPHLTLSLSHSRTLATAIVIRNKP